MHWTHGWQCRVLNNTILSTRLSNLAILATVPVVGSGFLGVKVPLTFCSGEATMEMILGLTEMVEAK